MLSKRAAKRAPVSLGAVRDDCGAWRYAAACEFASAFYNGDVRLVISTWFVGAALAVGLGACAGDKSVLTTPDDGGPDWIRLTSPHFTLSTDLEPELAQRALVAYEAEYDALSMAVFRRFDALDLHTHVVAFRTKREFSSFVPGSITVSVFYDQLAHDIEPEPTILTYGEPTKVTQFRFRHELAHRFMRTSLGALPPWLDEGLACYYSNIDVQPGQLVLGRDDLLRRFTEDEQWRPVNEHTHLTTEIPIAEVPDATELMVLPRRAFYAAHTDDAPRYDSEKRETVHYAAAWGLVHMLLNGPPTYREPFTRALAAAAEGESMVAALERELRGMSAQRFDRDFRWYLRAQPRDVWSMPYAPRPRHDVGARKMSSAEVLVTWARLSFDSMVTMDRLYRAVELAPKYADAHYWIGVVETHQGRPEAGRDAMRRAVALSPTSPRYLNGLAWVYSTQSDAWAQGDELPDVAARLRRSATSSAQFDTVAWYLAGQGEMHDAAAAARQAIDLDPNCWRCFDTYARILYSVGAVDAAETSQRVAVDRLPRWVPESIEREFVARWVYYRDEAGRR